MRPQRRQPTRLPRPWDSPGKNIGVACHFLLQCVKMKSESEITQLYPTLGDPMDCSLLGSSAHEIFQARVLEWVAIAFSATSLCIAPNSTPLKITSKTLKSKKHMEEPGRLQSMGSLRVGHDRVTSLSLFSFMHWRRKWQATPLFLPGESQGQRSLVGCRLWGHTESDTTIAT